MSFTSRFVVALVSVLWGLNSAAQAQTYFWDPTQTGTANGGGAGAWNTVDPFWYTGAGNVAWPNTSEFIASFGGPSAGTVTLSGPITANGLAFTTTGYTVTGSTLTLLSSSGAVTPTITLGATGTAANATVASILAGGNGITAQLAAGALASSLTLSAANTFTGGLTVSSGVTVNAVTGGNVGAGALNYNGGTIAYTPTAQVTFSAAQVMNVGAAGGILDNRAVFKLLINTAGGLTGSGTLTRNASANNVIVGSTNVLQISAANIGFTGAVILNGGQNEISTNGFGNGLTPGNTITVNGGAELTAANGIIPNPLTLNTNANIGGDNGTSTFSGPITVNGAFRVRLGDFYQASNRNLIISGGLTGTGSMTLLSPNTNTVPTAGAGQTLFLNGDNTGYTSSISFPAGFSVSFGTTNSVAPGGVTINSTATALGGLGVGFIPATQADLPVLAANNTGANGGVFQINVANFNTPLDLGTLYGSTVNPTSGTNGGWFLGAGNGNTASYTASSLAASNGVYRLGGGYGILTISNGVLTGSANVLVGATNIGTNGTGGIVLAGANDYTGTTTINPGSLLTASNSSALGSNGTGSGTTIAAGGQLGFSGGVTIAEPITGTGTSATATTTNYPIAINNVSGVNTLSGPVSITIPANNFRINSSSGTLNLTGTIALSGGNNTNGLVFSGGAAITQSAAGVISGTGLIISTSTSTITLAGANTFNGKLQIQQGTVSTPSLNSVASPAASSGLGVPANATSGLIDLGNGTTTGTLTYTGTGETTDRVVNLIGTTGGGTINQSGTGLLRFTSNFTATGAGIKTLTIGGSTAGTGEISGIIPNNSGTNLTSLTKSGSGTWTLSALNTYAGATTVTGGTLSINTLNAVSGGPSSLGNPTTVANGTIALGTTTTGATLQYTGTGSTSDRIINLAGTTGGGTLDMSGTGAFQIGAVNAPGAGVKTLTLTGSTGGTGIVAGAIANNSATNTTAVTKTGTGTWVLGGSNTYTGATTVSVGLLRINGSTTATSAVTVAAPAQLGGTGTVNGTVAVSALGGLDFRDGSIGVLTLGSTLALNGTATTQNNVYLEMGSAAIDRIAATGAVTASTAGGVLFSFTQLAGTPLPDGTYPLVTSAATSVPTGFALATTRAGGRTFALTTATTGTIAQVTVGTAVTGPAAAVFGGTASASWGAAGNWYTDASSNTPTGTIPGLGTNVAFYTTTPVAGNLTTTLGADFEINSLTYFATATTPTSITGTANALTIDAGTDGGNPAGNGISQLAAANHTISSRLGIGAAQTWNVADVGGTLTVSGLVFDTGAGFTLTKAGSGTLVLSGTANTFTGNVDVTAGTLAFAGNNGGNGDPLSLGAGPKFITVTNNAVIRPTSTSNPTGTNTKRFVVGTGGATFNVPTGVTFTLDDAGQFSGAADLTITGAGTGTVYLHNQAFNFSGNVIVNSGTLRVGTNTVLGTTPGRTITVTATGAAMDVNNTNTNIPLGITLNGTGISNAGALTAATASGTLASLITLGSNSSVGAGTGFTLSLTGAISGGFTLTKVGTGTVALSGANTYGVGGGLATAVNAGVLFAANTAALPNYATVGSTTAASGGTLSLAVGGAGEFNSTDVTTILGNSVFSSGSGIGFDTTDAGGSFTAPAIIATPTVAALNLLKAGTGTLVLPNANGFGTGSTTILAGTLSVTSGVTNPLGTGPLVVGTSNGGAANLDLGTSSQTVTTITVPSNTATANTITIGAGQTLTATGAVVIGLNNGTSSPVTNLNVFGATGTWSVGTVTTPTNTGFQIGANTTTNLSNGSTVDLSGLGTFYANLGTGTFRVGDASNSNGGATLDATVLLSPTSTIRATTLTSDSPDSGRTETIRLGTLANVFHANTIEIGGSTSGRASGILNFQTASGTLTVRNLAGTGRAAFNIAYGGTVTGAAPVSTVTLVGHQADLLLGNLQVGGRTGTSGGSSTGTLSFDTGTLDVTTINIARRASTDSGGGTTTGTSTGTVSIGGGSVTIGNGGVVIANNTSTLVNNPAVGTLNVSGGTVTIGATSGTSITLGSSVNAANGPATASFNLSGGSVTLAGNIVTGSATGTTATLTMTGGTLNMAGFAIGSATNIVNFAVGAGTLNQLGELNGGGALTKTTIGVLNLTGSSTYTGGTLVNAGAVYVIGQTGAQSGTGSGSVTVNATGTLGGNGRIAGTVNVVSGGTLQAGVPSVNNGIDTLTTGADVTFDSGATFGGRILNTGTPTPFTGTLGQSGVAGVDNSYLVSTGAITVASTGLIVSFDATGTNFELFTMTPYSYKIAQGGSIVGLTQGNPLTEFVFNPVGFSAVNASLNTDGSGGLFLNFTPTPEPVTVLGVLAIVAWVGRNRRRKLS